MTLPCDWLTFHSERVWPRTALDAAEHLSVSVEEATASSASATARGFLAWVSVSGAVAEVVGVAAVARREGPAHEDTLQQLKRQHRACAPAGQERFAKPDAQKSSRRCGARLACSGSGRVTIVSSRYGASRGVSRPSHHATWAEQPLASQAVRYDVKLRRARNIARTPQSSRRVTRCRVTPRHATGPASNPPSPTDDTFRTMLRRAYPASHVVRNCTSIDRCG